MPGGGNWVSQYFEGKEQIKSMNEDIIDYVFPGVSLAGTMWEEQ